MSDPLFKGLTRPAMMLGVTYSALVMNMMISLVLFLALNELVWLLLMIPIHGVMYVICRWDVRFFDILTVYLKTKGGDATRSLFKASSYRP